MRPERSRSRRSPVRRAKAALSTALDPQGNGSLVGWDNPDSGNKGSFTPVGKPFPLEARICRVFLAEVDCKGDEHAMQGTACSDKRGEVDDRRGETLEKDLNNGLALQRPRVSVHKALRPVCRSPNFTEDTCACAGRRTGAKLG